MTQLSMDHAIVEGHRDGRTYEPGLDYDRLNAQAKRVVTVMLDGQWHTLRGVSEATGDPEASISARLRDFRKEKFGRHMVERRRLEDGLWAYRIFPHEWWGP